MESKIVKHTEAASRIVVARDGEKSVWGGVGQRYTVLIMQDNQESLRKAMFYWQVSGEGLATCNAGARGSASFWSDGRGQSEEKLRPEPLYGKEGQGNAG